MALIGEFALWFFIGTALGVSVVVSRRSQRVGPPFSHAWFVYAAAMILSIGGFGLIYELDQMQPKSDLRAALGPILLIFAFFAPIVIEQKRQSK